MKSRSHHDWLSTDTVLSAAALALSTACTIAWLTGWFSGAESGLVTHGVILVSALVVSGGLLELLLRRLNRQQREAKQFLNRLCELSQPGCTTSTGLDGLPPIDAGSSWYSTLEQIRAAFAAEAERRADAEHARSASELRCRRETAEKERVLAILDRMNEPVVAVDSFDELLLANPSARRLLQMDDEGSTQRIFSNLAKCEKLVSLVADARRRKPPVCRSEEIEVDTPDGSHHCYNVTVSTLAEGRKAGASDDDAPGIVAVLRDVSGQKQMQKNHAEFVSNASHEMRAPLAGIKAYVEMLADGDAEDAETREQFLGVISGQTERLQRLIDNLLNLARIEAGVVKVSKQSQSLNDVLADALKVVSPTAEGKQITLRSELSSLYLGVLADRDLLLQAALNLLSNAIKYTPVGGTVTLRSRSNGDEVQFEVEDTGVGLSPEDCVKVFEKFYRVEKDKNMAAGTGLGLPLARHIVEDVHGGKLTVTSQLGVGSTFIITLPAATKNH